MLKSLYNNIKSDLLCGFSWQRSATRRNNDAKPEDDDTPTVTSRQYGRRQNLRFWRRQISKMAASLISAN